MRQKSHFGFNRKTGGMKTAQHLFQGAARKKPIAALQIAQPATRRGGDEFGRILIGDAARRRGIDAIEFPPANNNIGLALSPGLQKPRQIGGIVLAVAVESNDAFPIWLLQKITKSLQQSRALAPIHRPANSFGLALFDGFDRRIVASIVDRQNEIRERTAPLHDAENRIAAVVAGDQDRYRLSMVGLCHASILKRNVSFRKSAVG